MQGGTAIATDSQSQVQTSCCIHCPVLCGPLYLETPPPISLLEKGNFYNKAVVHQFSHCVPSTRPPCPPQELVTPTSALLGSKGQEPSLRTTELSELFSLSLPTPLPPPLTPTPRTHSHTFTSTHSAQRNTVVSPLLALGQHTLSIPLNIHLLPFPQNFPEAQAFP